MVPAQLDGGGIAVTHIPVEFETPTPAGEPLPAEYARNFDPFVALSAAAAITTTLGVGVGWLREEMIDHGTDPRTRVALVS